MLRKMNERIREIAYKASFLSGQNGNIDEQFLEKFSMMLLIEIGNWLDEQESHDGPCSSDLYTHFKDEK